MCIKLILFLSKISRNTTAFTPDLQIRRKFLIIIFFKLEKNQKIPVMNMVSFLYL